MAGTQGGVPRHRMAGRRAHALPHEPPMSSWKCSVAAAARSFASWSAASTLCDTRRMGDIFAYCHGARADVMANYWLVDALRPTLSVVKRFSGKGGEADLLYVPDNNDQSFAFQLYALGPDGGYTYAESTAGTYGKAEAAAPACYVAWRLRWRCPRVGRDPTG